MNIKDLGLAVASDKIFKQKHNAKVHGTCKLHETRNKNQEQRTT